MTATPTLREPAAARRTADRPAPPPVLIEVPALPGRRPTRPTGRRPSPRPATTRPRRLRREIKLAGVAAIVLGSFASGLLMAVSLRWTAESTATPDRPGAEADGRLLDPPPASPLAITLDVPEPLSAAPATEPEPEPEPEAEAVPEPADVLAITFPGHLLPGDDPEVGHARH